MWFSTNSATKWLLLVGVLCGSASAATAATMPYRSCFEKSAKAHKVSTTLLQAVAATESGWDPNARSSANAHGLMQIQWPGTARHLGVRRLGQLYSPCTSIELGARYLRELLDKYDNNERRALAAYNYGPGRIKTTGKIPGGAQRYVNTVNRHKRQLGQPTVVRPRHQPAGKRQQLAGKQQQKVAEFSSRSRADRFARLLRKRVSGATFSVARSSRTRYRVVLKPGERPLNTDEQTVLRSLGWTG